MPQLTPELLEAVRRRARISDLFDPAELRKAGKEYLSRCPWHDDQRPSLTVSPQRNRVHCFVCNRGTDAIGWLQDRQGLSFQEAVLELARRYGVSADPADPEAQRRLDAQRRQRQGLLQRRRQEREQSHKELLHQLEHGGTAAEYLRSRSISADTAASWHLGAASGRLVIPLNDSNGQTIGFCGRAIGALQPKYRNSPADVLFQRNALVFGLDRAAEAIRCGGTALLVEGPLDVIQLQQAGFGHAVACLGTSVSPLQLQLLQRHGMTQLQIALDGDPAGQRATERLLEQLLPQLTTGELGASVLQLPTGQDADGLVRSAGAEALAALVVSAQHWLEWRLDRLLSPLEAVQGSPDATPPLAVLQAIERQGNALVKKLSAGVLRRCAEVRLQQVLRTEDGSAPPVVDAAPLACVGPQAQTARQRAERRVLRLFIHASPCRELLAALQLQDQLCQAALDWLINLAVLAADDQLAAVAMQLAVQLPGALAAVLSQSATPGLEVERLLRSHPQRELEALLDVLEPGCPQRTNAETPGALQRCVDAL